MESIISFIGLTLFILMFCFFIAFIIILGMINPSLVIPWDKNPSRKNVIKTYLFLSFASFLLTFLLSIENETISIIIYSFIFCSFVYWAVFYKKAFWKSKWESIKRIKPRQKVEVKNKNKTAKEISLESLHEINIEIRKNILDLDLVMNIEEIIEKLRNIIPLLNNEYSSNELTWTVNKMATKYLKDIVLIFTRLNKKKQDENKLHLKKSLNSISNEIDEISVLISQKDEINFNKKAKFIEHRFSKSF